MATSGGKKSKASKKSASGQAPGAAKLRELIGEIIDAQNRGDAKLRDAAVRELEKMGSHAASTDVRQRAVEARAAAKHPVAVDSTRLLNEIAARLATGA